MEHKGAKPLIRGLIATSSKNSNAGFQIREPGASVYILNDHEILPMGRAKQINIKQESRKPHTYTLKKQ